MYTARLIYRNWKFRFVMNLITISYISFTIFNTLTIFISATGLSWVKLKAGFSQCASYQQLKSWPKSKPTALGANIEESQWECEKAKQTWHNFLGLTNMGRYTSRRKTCGDIESWVNQAGFCSRQISRLLPLYASCTSNLRSLWITTYSHRITNICLKMEKNNNCNYHRNCARSYK